MVHQVLHQILKLAGRRHLVGRIVTDDVDPPKRQKYRARPLKAAEETTLLRAIRDHRHGPLWTFLLGAGVRFGEAAGLTWAVVDLDAGTAEIRQAVTRHRQDGKVRLAIDAVKTDAGNRVVALPSWAVAALRAQRARVAELRLLAGTLWEDRDLVFPNRHGKPLAENHVLVTWHRAIEAANRRLQADDLRRCQRSACTTSATRRAPSWLTRARSS
jgi:integrase